MTLDNSLKLLSEALPLPGRASTVRSKFNDSLIESLTYLLDACCEVIPSDLFSRVKSKLASLNIELKFSGILSLIHEDFYEAVEQKDTQKVVQLVQKLDRDDFQVKEEIKYTSLSEFDEYYQYLIKIIAASETTEEVIYYTLSSEDYEKTKKTIQMGFEVLEKACPDFYKEAQDLISEVLILSAQRLKNGSSSQFYGMIYKCCSYRSEKLTDALEFLIHEQSHLYLHILNNTIDPLVLNPQERYEAPLRKELRPLMGIYHATFVIARVIYVLEKVLSQNEMLPEEKEYCQNVIIDYRERFHVGFNTLRENAQMTPLGSQLIQSASQLL